MSHRFPNSFPLFVLLAFVLSGCATLGALQDAGQPLDAYEIRPSFSGPEASGRPLAGDLVVETPVVSGALATDRILIRPRPLEARYLPGARWTDPAPEMVQSVLVRGLAATGGLRYVGRRPLGTSGDYALLTEMTDFQAEIPAPGAAPLARVRLSARLVREADARIVAARVFEATALAGSDSAGDVVRALDAAMASLMPELSAWLLGRLGQGGA